MRVLIHETVVCRTLKDAQYGDGVYAGHSDQKNLEGMSVMYNLKMDVICLSETSGPKQVLQCTV